MNKVFSFISKVVVFVILLGITSFSSPKKIAYSIYIYNKLGKYTQWEKIFINFGGSTRTFLMNKNRNSNRSAYVKFSFMGNSCYSCSYKMSSSSQIYKYQGKPVTYKGTGSGKIALAPNAEYRVVKKFMNGSYKLYLERI